MIEKSSVRGQFFPQEAQAIHNAFARLSKRNISPILPNADRGQPESSSCYAAHEVVIIRSHIASISHHSGLRVGLLPKIEEICLFQFFQQAVIGLRQERLDGRARSLQVLLRGCVQQWAQAACKWQTY